MAKFMALYMAPAAMIAEMMGNTTPAQAKAGMDEWMSWSKKHEKMIDDLGMPLGKTKRVSTKGVSDTRNDITGYSIVSGDSADAVTAMFRDHPHLKMGDGATIEVIELVSLPGMSM